jgi:hypothetical protein
MDTTYPSKKDAWLVLLVGFSAVALMASAAAFWAQTLPWSLRLLGSGMMAIGSLFTVDLVLRTYYTLSEHGMRIRCGVFRWHVPYASIQSIRRSRTLLSGPALSLDRMVVSCTDRLLPLVISPVDQQQFFVELNERDAGLKVVAEGVVRREAGDSP